MTKLLFTLAAAFLSFAQPAIAQSYPNKTVRVIVPYAPGGATDITGRIFAGELAIALKQPVIVENRPGASGTVGINQVAKADPDGYTLGVSGVGPTVIRPLVDSKLPYDPMRDLRTVAGLSIVEFLVLARPSFAPNNLKELFAFAKDNPGKVNYGTAGVGGPQQLQIEHLAMLAGVKLFHVPFTGDGPSLTALLSGNIDIALIGVGTGLSLVKEGKLKPLAVAGSSRLKALPNLQTVVEQTGFTEFTGTSWNILVAPIGTPPGIVATLNKAINDISENVEVQKKLDSLGLRIMPGSSKDTSDFVVSEIAKSKRVIEVIGIQRE